MFTDNPIADFYRYEDERARFLKKLPKCSCCKEPIQDDECYEINDELICPECLNDKYMRWTDEYIEE